MTAELRWQRWGGAWIADHGGSGRTSYRVRVEKCPKWDWCIAYELLDQRWLCYRTADEAKAAAERYILRPCPLTTFDLIHDGPREELPF